MIPRPAPSWERSIEPMALPSNLMGCGICWSSATEFISPLELPTKNTDCSASLPKTSKLLPKSQNPEFKSQGNPKAQKSGINLIADSADAPRLDRVSPY